MVYKFVNLFVHQNMKDVIHKKPEICSYRFIQQSFNHHKQLWQDGNCVIFSGVLNLSCSVKKEWTMYCCEQ